MDWKFQMNLIEDVQVADDIANACHSVKVSVDSIKQACKADKIEIYLSGKDNFRDSIPLPTKYKSNRQDQLRPILLDEIRAYIVKKYKAGIVNGEEVDDVVCHRMWDGYKSGQKIIGVTRDKDACGSTGWLYNRDKMTEPEYIQGLGELHIDGKGKVRGKGRKWLYHQILIGDNVDGYRPTDICGVKFGEKSSYKLLEPMKTDRDCWQVVYDTYKSWYPDITNYVDYTGVEREVDVFFILQMYTDCARMRRWENDLVDVKQILIKLGVKF
jgi:hypothetical protein